MIGYSKTTIVIPISKQYYSRKCYIISVSPIYYCDLGQNHAMHTPHNATADPI